MDNEINIKVKCRYKCRNKCRNKCKFPIMAENHSMYWQITHKCMRKGVGSTQKCMRKGVM